MVKNLTYRDKLIELAKIYKITEVQNYIKNKKYLTTSQIEHILKKNKVPIPTEINKSLIEIQAKKKGGFVHILLGNHEYMVFQNDLRYIHSKYHKTPFLLGIEYKELYGKNTVIGKWLRSKPTIIKINDIMFTHAGISREFFSSVNFDLDKINRDMRESIDLSIDEMVSNNFYNIYFGEKSLTWYRGYYYHDMTDKQLNKLLDKIDAKHIVVGHSSSDNVLELYDNIVYCVDSSMKLGEYGEILLIKNNVFYRGTLSGKLIKL